MDTPLSTPLLIAQCFVISNVLPTAFVGELLAACQGQTVNQIFHSHLHNETLKNLPEPQGPNGPVSFHSISTASLRSPSPSSSSTACVHACAWRLIHKRNNVVAPWSRSTAVSVSIGRNLLLRRVFCFLFFSAEQWFDSLFFWHFSATLKGVLRIPATFAYAKSLWR